MAGLEQLFRFRYAIARIGEADWLRWWESNALSPAGHYAMPRLFRRTAQLSAAHIAFAAARARHDAGVPDEPRVHLFDFGELLEGGFERWLIARKAERWTPESLPSPTDRQKASVVESLRGVGIEPGSAKRSNGAHAVAVGVIPGRRLETTEGRRRVAERLAGAYVASVPGQLVVPYLRLER